MGLTDEQKRRIEEKRAEALAKRGKLEQQKRTDLTTTSNIQNPAAVSRPTFATVAPAQIKGNHVPSISPSTFYNATTANNKASTSSSNYQQQRTSTFNNTFLKNITSTNNTNKTTSTFNNSSVVDSYTNRVAVNRPNQSSFKQFNKVITTCTLISRSRFQVTCSFHEKLIKSFKTLKTGSYNAKTKIWNFDLSEYDSLIQSIGSFKEELDLQVLPRWVLSTFREPKDYHVDSIDLSRIESTIIDSLMPFQRQGIQYGISRKGRVLIADDMGLGKTIQALGLASYYRESWPFLVVAPSSMRFAWESAILRWLPSLTETDISTIQKGKDLIGSSTVVIISYDLLSKKTKELSKKGFQLVIMDESHCIKNDKSARTRAADPLMRECKHLILLTGTPALSRPMELFSQISALQPGMFRWVKEFGFRYCDGKIKKFGDREVHDFSGSSNMQELSLVLQETCMIRRLKSEVLKQLPSKQRCMVVLDPTVVDASNKSMRDKEKAVQKSGVHGMEKRGLLLEWYCATAQAKLRAVQEYVTDLLSTDKKFLIFCHHQVMISGLDELLKKNKTGFIRIDGSTPSDLRKQYVDRFQTSSKCQVALLSITAANSGITLTAAQLVVFAEIYWNPGILTQAEDRAHRIGQTDSVTIQYLVAKGTADDELWPMIQKKLDVLNKAGLTKDNFQDSDSKVMVTKTQKTLDEFFTPETKPSTSKSAAPEDRVDDLDDLDGAFDDDFEDEFDEAFNDDFEDMMMEMSSPAKKLKIDTTG